MRPPFSRISQGSYLPRNISQLRLVKSGTSTPTPSLSGLSGFHRPMAHYSSTSAPEIHLRPMDCPSSKKNGYSKRTIFFDKNPSPESVASEESVSGDVNCFVSPCNACPPFESQEGSTHIVLAWGTPVYSNGSLVARSVARLSCFTTCTTWACTTSPGASAQAGGDKCQ